MKHTKVKELLNSTTTINKINAKGWVRTFRNNQFMALNDGSTLNNIQFVVGFENSWRNNKVNSLILNYTLLKTESTVTAKLENSLLSIWFPSTNGFRPI